MSETIQSFETKFRAEQPNYKPDLTGRALINSLNRDMFDGQLISHISDWNNTEQSPSTSAWSIMTDYNPVVQAVDLSWKLVNPILNLIPGMTDRPSDAAGPGTSMTDKFLSSIEGIPGFISHFKANSGEYLPDALEALRTGAPGTGTIFQLGKALYDLAESDKGIVDAQLRSGKINQAQHDMAIKNIDKASAVKTGYDATIGNIKGGFNGSMAWALGHEDSDSMFKYWNHKSYEWAKWSHGKHQERLDEDPELRALEAWHREETPSMSNVWHPQMWVRGFETLAPTMATAALPGGVFRVAGAGVQSLGKGTAISGLVSGSNTMVKVGTAGYQLGNTAVALSNRMTMPMMAAMEGGNEFTEAMYFLVDDPEGPRISREEAVPIAGQAATFYGLSSGLLERFQFNNAAKYLNIDKAAKKGWLRAATAKLYQKSSQAGGYQKWIGRGAAILADNFAEAGVEATQTVLQDIVNEGIRQGYGGGSAQVKEKIAMGIWETVKDPVEAYSKPEVRQAFWETFAGMVPGNIMTSATGNKLKDYPEMRDMVLDGEKIHVRAEGNKIIINVNGVDTVSSKAPNEESAKATAKNIQSSVSHGAPELDNPLDFQLGDIETSDQLALALAHQLWGEEHGDGASTLNFEPIAASWAGQSGATPSTLNDVQKILYANRKSNSAIDQFIKLIELTGNKDLVDQLGIPDTLKQDIKEQIRTRWTATKMQNVNGDGSIKNDAGRIAVEDALDPDDVMGALADPDSLSDPDDVKNQTTRAQSVADIFDTAVNSVPGLDSSLMEVEAQRRSEAKDITDTDASDPDDILKDENHQSVQQAIDQKQEQTRLKVWSAKLDLNTISEEGLVGTLEQVYAVGGTAGVVKAIMGRKKKKNTSARKKLNLTSLNTLQKNLGLGFSSADVSASTAKVADAVANAIHKRTQGKEIDTSTVTSPDAPAPVSPVATDTGPQTTNPATKAGFVKKYKKILNNLIRNGNDNIINASINSLLNKHQGVDYNLDDIRTEIGIGKTDESQIGTQATTAEETIVLTNPEPSTETTPPVKKMTPEEFKAIREQQEADIASEFEDEGVPGAEEINNASEKLDDEIGECLL